MNLRTTAVISWACLLATAAIAGEEKRTHIEIEVDDDVSGHQAFTFDSQDAGFDLDSMVVGETRNLTDASGNTADVSRTDDGFEFDVNGKTIKLDNLHEVNGLHDEHEVEIHVDQSDNDVIAVKRIKKVKMIKTTDAAGVTVISDNGIDVDSDMHAHGTHEIRIIKKEIDVTD